MGGGRGRGRGKASPLPNTHTHNHILFMHASALTHTYTQTHVHVHTCTQHTQRQTHQQYQMLTLSLTGQLSQAVRPVWFCCHHRSWTTRCGSLSCCIQPLTNMNMHTQHFAKHVTLQFIGHIHEKKGFMTCILTPTNRMMGY